MSDSETSSETSAGLESNGAGTEPGIDRKLLDFLVCPVTHATLKYDAERQELISETAGLAYPIRDGIPIMLPEEARELKA